jgi:mgtE-like transporter
MTRYNVWRIMREGMITTLLAALINSSAGFLLRSVEKKLLMVPALLVIIPALNDMAGDFGCIISSKFSTMLYLGTVKLYKRKHFLNFFSYFLMVKDVFKNKKVVEFISTIFVLAIFSSLYLGFATVVLSLITGIVILPTKVLLLAFFGGISLTIIVLFSALVVGAIAYKKDWDPDNVTIPIVTSIGDVGGIISLLFISKLIGLI